MHVHPHRISHFHTHTHLHGPIRGLFERKNNFPYYGT
jgi:hypothetical protein